MANTKISALTAATTPVAGTEVLPIVQSSTTKQVSIANLTAGRSVSAADYVMSTGNLVPSTAAKGVNFTANTALAGMTSQLLNWYEEGTYTPTITATSGTLTTVTATGNYTRIGRQVTVNVQATLTNAGTGSGALVATLPFACGKFPAIGVGREDNTTGFELQARIISATPSSMYILTYVNGAVVITGYVVQVTITYFV